MRSHFLAAFLFIGCSAKDVDLDGFGADEDCDDADPLVYPGAPDTPADGVDGDCDGEDPELGWTGYWSLTYLTATYSGVSLFQDDTALGEATLEDGLASLTVGGTLNPDVVGAAYTIEVVLSGQTSPVDGEESFVLYAEGENYDEQMHVDWDCAMEADTLLCAGELKALEVSLDADAIWERPAAL